MGRKALALVVITAKRDGGWMKQCHPEFKQQIQVLSQRFQL